MGLRLLLLLVCLVTATSAGSNTSKLVTTLPGYSGELPFKLETGWIYRCRENETAQLFYYFVESQRNPWRDPVLIWVSGGPGCSGLDSFVFESGPLTFKLGHYNGSLPTLHDNPWTWTQWLSEHPQFLENQIYVGGESYGGKPVPMILQQIVIGNEAGSVPLINLKEHLLESPMTDTFTDSNSKVPFAHRLTLISYQLYESAKTSCNSNFVNVDSSNYQCSSDIDAIDALLNRINTLHILQPYCLSGCPESNEESLSERHNSAPWCRGYNHMLCSNWANDKGVQEALGIRKGTKHLWQYCNSTLAYTKTVTNVVGYHQNLTNADLRLLIYSGDHDMSVPNIGTQEWIKSLNLTTDESWRVWSVDGQTAGYTKKLIIDDFSLTYATVKGGGHNAAEDMVKDSRSVPP